MKFVSRLIEDGESGLEVTIPDSTLRKKSKRQLVEWAFEMGGLQHGASNEPDAEIASGYSEALFSNGVTAKTVKLKNKSKK